MLTTRTALGAQDDVRGFDSSFNLGRLPATIVPLGGLNQKLEESAGDGDCAEFEYR